MHDPAPDTVDVDGVPYAVERCRRCGLAVHDDPGRWSPCRGRNHTLTDY